MSRNQKLIIIALACVILVLTTWQITLKVRSLNHDPGDPGMLEIQSPGLNTLQLVTRQLVRQEALKKYGSLYFRPCTISWDPPPNQENFGSVQAYIIYVDGVQQTRLEKDVHQWFISIEGIEVAVRAANSKGESRATKLNIPLDCLPLPK